MKILFAFIFIFSFACNSLQAQKMPELPANAYRVIIQGDTVQEFHVAGREKSSRLREGRIYHWYAAQQLSITEGDYSGALLEGTYIKKRRDQVLLEKGEFEMGLKEAEWREWYTNGRLKAKVNWKKGVQHGAFEEYTPEGRLLREGHYRKGKLHGTVKLYEPTGKVIRLIYKRGELKKEIYPLPKGSEQKNAPALKEKPNFWSRLFGRQADEQSTKVDDKSKKKAGIKERKKKVKGQEDVRKGKKKAHKASGGKVKKGRPPFWKRLFAPKKSKGTDSKENK